MDIAHQIGCSERTVRHNLAYEDATVSFTKAEIAGLFMTTKQQSEHVSLHARKVLRIC